MPMTEIYNIVAELCAHVIGACTEEFFFRVACMSENEKNRIDGIIYQYVPELTGKSGVKQLTENVLTKDFYGRLRTLINVLYGREDNFAVVRLAQNLDEALEGLIGEEFKALQSESFSVMLNSNRESVGIGLLPRCHCSWERKRRLSDAYNRMDNFLYNFLLIENSVMGEMVDMHYFLKDDFFPDYARTGELKIAASPLRNDMVFSVGKYEEESVNKFSVNFIDELVQEQNELIWQKIMLAAEQRANIIIFPEMLGNAQTESCISSRLKALEDNKDIPSLIILPSYWDSKKHKNTVSVLDRYGSVLCRQNKQYPFRQHDGNTYFMEDIYSSMTINIFHCNGIGRFAILICKDFLTTRYMERLMRCFKLTLILVPSFSSGSYDFRQSFDLCAHDDCNVVWLNTCAACMGGKADNFKCIGYVRKRISRFADESQKLCEMRSCEQLKNAVCDKSCIFYETIGGV